MALQRRPQGRKRPIIGKENAVDEVKSSTQAATRTAVRFSRKNLRQDEAPFASELFYFLSRREGNTASLFPLQGPVPESLAGIVLFFPSPFFFCIVATFRFERVLRRFLTPLYFRCSC